MPFDDSLLAPGPVNLHPDVRQILAQPMIHHRTPQFDAILKRTLQNLKMIFETTMPVYMHSSTGSGGMESLLVNTLSPGDSVLAIVSGKFGERWAEMAKTFGAQVHVQEVPWGQAVDAHQVREYLHKNPQTKAVLTQACETSTGVVHPIQELGEVVAKYHDCLLLVDGITAVGAFPLPMDTWKIDGLVAGSQKAFMLPTGLSFVSFSEKAQPRLQSAKMPRYYFDIRKEMKANLAGETFFSSSVILIRALDFMLNLIAKKGMNALFKEIHNRAELTRVFAPRLGFSLYAQSPSDSLTALSVPKDIDGQKLRALLETKHGITVMGGQDQAKGKILRIGHMGYITDQEMQNLFHALALSLNEFQSGLSEPEIAKLIADIKIWQQKNPGSFS